MLLFFFLGGSFFFFFFFYFFFFGVIVHGSFRLSLSFASPRFNATNQGDRWTISQINLTVGAKSGGKADNGNLTDSPLRADDLDLVVPILYSFHCSSMKLYVDTVRNTGLVGYKGTYVILGGLQVSNAHQSQSCLLSLFGV